LFPTNFKLKGQKKKGNNKRAKIKRTHLPSFVRLLEKPNIFAKKLDLSVAYFNSLKGPKE